MRASFLLFAIFTVLAGRGLLPQFAVARIWITTSGSWANSANWNNNFSPGIDDISIANLGEDASIALNGNQTTRRLVFGDLVPSHNWFLIPGTPATSTLTLDPNTGEPIIDVVNQTTTFRVVLAGTEGLTKTGLGKLVLTRQNTYSGTTAVRSGTLALDFSDSGVQSNIIRSDSELRLGSLAMTAGGGTIELIGTPGASNSQTFSGTTLLFGRNGFAIDQNDATSIDLFLGFFDRDVGSVAHFTLPAAGRINAVSATLPNMHEILGGWATIGSGPNATWAANDGAGNVVPCTAFTELTAAPNIANDPATNVRWSNSTGDATVAAGTTNINTLLFADAARRTVAIPAGATLRLGASGGIFKTDNSAGAEDSQLTVGLSGSFLTAGGVLNSIGELTLNANSSAPDQNALVVNSSISNNGLAPVYLLKSGNAAALLTSTSTHSGGTYVTSGRLGASANGAFGTGPIHVATGAQVLLAGGSHVNDMFISGSGLAQPHEGALRFEGAGPEARGKITLLDDASIVNGAANLAVVSGQITGAHDLVLSSTRNGVITLTNSMNNWTGNTTIGPGTLRIGGAGEVIPHNQSMNMFVMHGDPTSPHPTVLDLNGTNETINGLSSSGDHNKVVIRNSGFGAATLRLGEGSDGESNFAGRIEDGVGTLGITKTGHTTQVLTGTNTYSGSTNVDEGKLRIGSRSAIPSGTSLLVNGTLDLNGFDIFVSSLNGRGLISAEHRESPSTITVTGGNGAFSGLIVSYDVYQPVGLTIESGMQTLSGANFYMGPTTINGGTLSITGYLEPNGTVTVNSGGTLSGTGTFNNGRVGHVTMQPGSRVAPGATPADGMVGTLTMSSLTVNGGDLRFDLANGGASDRLSVVGIATFAGPSTISTSTITPGTYTLLTADTLRGIPPTINVPADTRASFALNFETLTDRIGLTVAGSPPKSLTWTGASGSEWDVKTAANWTDGTTAEQFFNLDTVTFADGPSNRNVVLNSTVFPTSVTVNNSAGSDYTIAGTGGISDWGFGSATTLTKSGTGSLILGGTNTYAGTTTVNQGLLRVTGSLASNNAVTVARGATFAVEGTASVGGLSGLGATSVGGGQGDALLTAHFIQQSSLTLSADSTVKLNTNGGTSAVAALSIAGGSMPTARLDLNNNPAIIEYSDASPVETVRAQIVAGRGGPGLGADWNGMGITSSAAAAAAATEPESRSIGYADNALLPLGPYTIFRAQRVDDTAVLMAYTRTGDANLDGVVDDDDVTIVGATYAPGVPQPHWALGDFDYNGFVDDDDVTLLGVFYDPSAPPLIVSSERQAEVAAVPEPSALTIALLAGLIGIAVASGRRYRSKSSGGA